MTINSGMSMKHIGSHMSDSTISMQKRRVLLPRTMRLERDTMDIREGILVTTEEVRMDKKTRNMPFGSMITSCCWHHILCGDKYRWHRLDYLFIPRFRRRKCFDVYPLGRFVILGEMDEMFEFLGVASDFGVDFLEMLRI